MENGKQGPNGKSHMISDVCVLDRSLTIMHLSCGACKMKMLLPTPKVTEVQMR